MTCASCQHFAAGEIDATVMPTKEKATIGICRRYPPRPFSASDLTSVFPAVHKGHQCGEYHSGAMPI